MVSDACLPQPMRSTNFRSGPAEAGDFRLRLISAADQNEGRGGYFS
jgi:hypothetical protein